MKSINLSLPPSRGRGKKKITPLQPPVKPALSWETREQLKSELAQYQKTIQVTRGAIAELEERVLEIEAELFGNKPRSNKLIATRGFFLFIGGAK